MIRYSYNQQLTPPAPFVHVTVRPPERGIAVSDLPALLDTAADITVIPARIAEELQLIPLDEVPIGGFDGRVSWVSTFLVQLALRQSTPKVHPGRRQPRRALCSAGARRAKRLPRDIGWAALAFGN